MNFFSEKTPKLYLSEIETFIPKKYRNFFPEKDRKVFSEKIKNIHERRPETFFTEKIPELFFFLIRKCFLQKNWEIFF
jgi:hypothetical protein